MTNCIVIYISKSTGLPFAVLRQRVPLLLTGSEVKKLISEAGEFLWLPSEYELYNAKNNMVVDDNISLAKQDVNEGCYLYTRITDK